jgi:hypothetical protein
LGDVSVVVPDKPGFLDGLVGKHRRCHQQQAEEPRGVQQALGIGMLCLGTSSLVHRGGMIIRRIDQFNRLEQRD